MRTIDIFLFLFLAIGVTSFGTSAEACHKRKHRCTADSTVLIGISWSDLQSDQRRGVQAAIQTEIQESGAKFISTDAQNSLAKQILDVESLIAQGVSALIIFPVDPAGLGPIIEVADAESIPIISYDAFSNDERVRSVSFDYVEVGRLQAQALLEASADGQYVILNGSSSDPNSYLVRAGQQEVLQPAIDSGDITIAGEAFTDGWLPANAEKNLEQVLSAADNDISAVLAADDSTADGAIAALEKSGLTGIPVSGQDATAEGLKRIAQGLQTVSIWTDERELGTAAAITAISLALNGASHQFEDDVAFTTPEGTEIQAYLQEPIPITQENLGLVIDAGWISQGELCRGVTNGPTPCN